jgi:hypothetical protein
MRQSLLSFKENFNSQSKQPLADKPINTEYALRHQVESHTKLARFVQGSPKVVTVTLEEEPCKF